VVPLNLTIQLVSGVIGGNAASGALRHRASGTADNSLLGALGGVGCAQLPGLVGLGGFGSGSLDLTSLAVQMACGVIGGGALVSVIRIISARRKPGRSRGYRAF
jgi:hypothetical protein